MGKKLRIGLLGGGRIGKLHGTNIQNFVPDAEVTILADPFMNADMEAWAAGIGIPKCTKDPDEVFASNDVDAVFICSSTATHAEFIIKAAQAGKHIFCEKPIHTDVSKIKEALEAVEKAGVKLQVGFVRRFDRSHKAVRDVVASGKLGKPFVVKVCSRDPNGAIGVIDNCRQAPYGYDQRVEVLCEKGAVQDNNHLENEAYISTAETVSSAKPTYFFLERYNDAFVEETIAFVKAVLEDGEVPVTGKDGLEPVRIAIAAAKSLKEGRPVSLSEIEG